MASTRPRGLGLGRTGGKGPFPAVIAEGRGASRMMGPSLSGESDGSGRRAPRSSASRVSVLRLGESEVVESRGCARVTSLVGSSRGWLLKGGG